VPSRARVNVSWRGFCGVFHELAIDGVGDSTLQTPNGLKRLLALGSLAAVVHPAVSVEADLADRGDVDHVIDPAVAGS